MIDQNHTNIQRAVQTYRCVTLVRWSEFLDFSARLFNTSWPLYVTYCRIVNCEGLRLSFCVLKQFVCGKFKIVCGVWTPATPAFWMYGCEGDPWMIPLLYLVIWELLLYFLAIPFFLDFCHIGEIKHWRKHLQTEKEKLNLLLVGRLPSHGEIKPCPCHFGRGWGLEQYKRLLQEIHKHVMCKIYICGCQILSEHLNIMKLKTLITGMLAETFCKSHPCCQMYRLLEYHITNRPKLNQTKPNQTKLN